MAKVTMPQLGESVAEGTIGRWLKQPGDTVAKYEPLLEVITDKVNAEVPSPFAGVLKEILAQEGDTVPNNAEIAVIETEDEALSGGTEAPAAPAPSLRQPTPEPAHGPAGSDERPVAATARRARGCRGPGPGTGRSRAGARLPGRRHGGADAHRRRRPERPHDPGRPPPAPRARPRGVAGRRDRRRRADHPRGRHRRRRGPAHGHRSGGARVGTRGTGAARPAPAGRRVDQTPGSRSPPARTRSSSR